MLVIKGKGGLIFLEDFLILETFQTATFLIYSMTLSAYSLEIILRSFPSKEIKVGLNYFLFPYVKTESIVQYSYGTNKAISLSRSAINFKATDCTLPADNPIATFFHKMGEISNPTHLSKTLLAY